MKFYGPPNMLVRDFRKQKALFRFDDKGEFETLDSSLIKKLKRKFKHDQCAEISENEPENEIKNGKYKEQKVKNDNKTNKNEIFTTYVNEENLQFSKNLVGGL